MARGRARRVVGRAAGLILLLLVGAIGFAWTPDTDPAAMRAKYGAPPSQFVRLPGGLVVHLRDEGPRDAPVLLLLHGSNADLHTWDGWVDRLKERYRVVRFDQIGHGLTGPNPRGDYRQAAFVDTVEQVRAQLGIPRMALGGNSMGGGVALGYALAHPDRVDALLLVDAASAPLPTARSAPIGFRLAATPGVRELLVKLTPRWLVATSVRGVAGEPTSISEAAITRYWELLRYPGNREATLARTGQRYSPVDRGRLQALRIPTLILWGGRDRLIPLASGRWLADAIPGAQLVVFPRLGHIPMEEAPAESLAPVAPWLAAHLKR